MEKRGLFTRFEEMRKEGEDGVALASVVILSFVILIVAASLMGTLVSATNLTANNRSNVVTFASAESGTDQALLGAVANRCNATGSDDSGYEYEVFRSADEDAPSGLDDSALSPGCPQDGDRYITIKSNGLDARGNQIEIISTYRWIIRNLGSAEGAVVAGTGLSNISQLGVYNTDGDLLIESGNFDCNSNSNISGDVVVMNGSISMSNACRIHGSIYASGNIVINNNAAGVDGDVYTMGDFGMSTAATVKGSVRAAGNLTISSGAIIEGNVTGLGTGQTGLDNVRVLGSVFTAGPVRLQNGSIIGGSIISTNGGTADVYNARVNGDFLIDGRIQQFAASTLGGNLSARAGGSHAIAPTVSTPGWIRVGGTISSWNGGPSAGAGKLENQTIAAQAPITFVTPPQLLPDFFNWRDWNYVESDWTTAGYVVQTLADCNFQDHASVRNLVNSASVPTVYDLRGCGEVKAFNVDFTPRADVAFILGDGMKNFQGIKVNAAPGTGEHEFILMTPDLTEDGNPSCVGGFNQSNSINIYGVQFGSTISSFIYSPCMVKFGGNSNLSGQIYTGNADYTAGGTTNFNYVEMFVPGFPVPESEDVPAAFDADATERVLPTLVSRSES